MYLFFQTAANGKPRSWRAPATDTFNWPRLVHLSWLMYNKERELIASRDHIIKPKGWEISEESERKHKVTPIDMQEKGVELSDVLMDFAEALEDAEYVTSYNMKLNESVLVAEYQREGLRHGFGTADKYCLMQEATWFTKIKGTDGKYKWPKLQDIHSKLFQARYADGGNALADVSVVALSFFAMLDIEAIEIF
ncbi:MAG: hypothetical protein AAGK47_05675 [Bacteroidota bacterium]